MIKEDNASQIEAYIKEGLIHQDVVIEKTPLIVYAAYYLAFNVLDLLFRRGVNVHAVTADGANALMVICLKSHHYKPQERLEIAKKLISLGADVNAANVKGETPLHYCRYSFFAAMMDLLLKNNADPEKQNKAGESALNGMILSSSIVTQEIRAILHVQLDTTLTRFGLFSEAVNIVKDYLCREKTSEEIYQEMQDYALAESQDRDSRKYLKA